jgi:hypothetical protein
MTNTIKKKIIVLGGGFAGIQLSGNALFPSWQFVFLHYLQCRQRC